MLSLIALSGEDVEQLDLEILAILQATPRQARELVAILVRQSRAQFAARFYDTMLKYPRAQFFLDNDVVNKRLHSSMENWLLELFRLEAPSPQQIRLRQMEVGAVHARIRVPVSLVMRGFRDLKRNMIEGLRYTRSSTEEVVEAVNYIAAMLDVSLAIMTAAYVRHSERGARAEEALRLFSMAQDIATERERQRAGLAEWAQNVFLTAQLDGGLESIPPLGRSDFALWLAHRADLIFGKSSEYRAIGETIARCDDYFAALKEHRGNEGRVEILLKVRECLNDISSMLNIMFKAIDGEEHSRDPLTKLFNRRFLNTTISHEIQIHKQQHATFSMVVFGIADYEALRKSATQQELDEFVRRCSQFIIDSVRSSDTVFRISEARFLVVRVESDRESGERYAQGVSRGFKALHFNFDHRGGGDLALLYSVSEYDGHPDPKYVIRAAERATLNPL